MNPKPRGRVCLTVRDLAERLGLPFEGDGDVLLQDVASLEEAQPGDLVYLAQPKFRHLLEETRASAAIVPVEEAFKKIPVLKSPHPHHDFVRAVEIFYTPYRPEPGVHPTAVVSPTARLGKGVSIGPLCVVGDGASIGDGTVLFPLVSIYPRVRIGSECVIHSHVSIREDVVLGNRVILHNGVVVGSDGFGYLQAEDKSHIKIPQKGTVVIEDDVEVGANTAVDRAALGRTLIGRGTKIDNLVQVAHNVEVGPCSILAGQTGIAGSSKIGKNAVLAGQVGVSDHVTLGDNVVVAAKTGVAKDIPADSFIAGGLPAQDVRTWRKMCASLPQLYDLLKEVRRLKERVEELEKKLSR